MSLVTIQQVRDKSGAPIAIVDDATLQRIIDEVQRESLNYFSVYITPTKVLEIKDGNGKNQIRINRPYLWKLLELRTGFSNTSPNTIDIENTTIDPKSSMITLRSFLNVASVGLSYFFHAPNSVKIKYLSAFMEKTIVITETTADIAVGTSVAIPVDSETGFTIDDWVLIEGLDGKREAAQVTATAASEITVNQLVQSHEDGSVISLLQTEQSLVQFILYAASVAVAVNAVGSTYSIATGYTLPEFTVQKGVPWTHWQNNYQDNEKRRNEAKNKIWSKLNPIS